MSTPSKLDIDYKVQLVECAFFAKGHERPHTVFTTPNELQGLEIWINPQKSFVNAEQILERILQDKGITSLEMVAQHPQALATVLEMGRCEFLANFPADFPAGQLQLGKGKEAKAVDRAILKLNVRLWQKTKLN